MARAGQIGLVPGPPAITPSCGFAPLRPG